MTTSLTKLTKEELIERLDILQEVAVNLIKSSNRNESLRLIVEKAMELSIADGGSLYLLSEDKKHLVFEVLINQTFDTEKFSSFKIPITQVSMATYSFNNNESLNINDVYLMNKELDYKFNDSLDKLVNYRTKSMLVVPLVNSKEEVIGVIQLINRKDFYKKEWSNDFEDVSKCPPFSNADKEITKRFSTLAAAYLEGVAPSSSNEVSEFDQTKDYLY